MEASHTDVSGTILIIGFVFLFNIYIIINVDPLPDSLSFWV